MASGAFGTAQLCVEGSNSVKINSERRGWTRPSSGSVEERYKEEECGGGGFVRKESFGVVVREL